MQVALFDLDNTLIAGDSDRLWGDYLVAVGGVDSETFAAENERFYREYEAGTLDIDLFLAFALRPLAEHDEDVLLEWREEFIREWIEPLILEAGRDLIQRHRDRGDRLAVVTATNRFVTEPIVERLGIETLLATEPERRGGRYTGRHVGTPTFQEGKVVAVRHWLATEGLAETERWFYSDSLNDLPLLREVEHPVAVDPDNALRREAKERGWPVISLR